MNEHELERMVVRLLGDGSLYTKMCNDAVKDTQQAATKITTFGKIIEGTKKTLEGFGGALKKVGQGLRSIGTLASVGITAPITALAGVATNEFNNFEAALSRMKGLVGLTDTEIQGFKTHILELAKDVGKSPIELAAAMENITSSGIQGATALETLDITAKAAAGGLGEVRSVSSVVTQALNAYGTANLTATQATDQLVNAVRLGSAEAETFAPVLGNVLPIAAQMKISFDEAAGSIAYLTLTTGSASTAATNYQNLLNQILKLRPDKEAGKALTKAGIDIEAFQKTVSEQNIHVGLMQLKTDLEKAGLEMKDAFPDLQALTAALQMSGENAAQFGGILDDMTRSTGKAQAALDAAAETTKHQLAKSMAEMKVILIEIGEMLVPIFSQMMSWTSKAMQTWKGLTAESKRWVLAILAGAAAIGPILIGLGTFISFAGGLVTTLGASVGAFGTLLAAINPITITLTVLGAGVVYLVYQMGLWSKAVDWFGKQWQSLVAYVTPAIEGIKQAIAQGDLELAFRIAWAQIKITFNEGIISVQQLWTDFRVNLTSGWYDTVNVIKVAWAQLMRDMKIGQRLFYTQGTFGEDDPIVKKIKKEHEDYIDMLTEEKQKAIKATKDAVQPDAFKLNNNIFQAKHELEGLLKRAKNPLAVRGLGGIGAGIPGFGEGGKPPVIPPGIEDEIDKLQNKAKINIELKFDAAGKGSAEALSRINDYRNAIGFQYNVPSMAKKQNIDPWEAVRQHAAANPDRFNPKMVRGGGFKGGDANEEITAGREQWTMMKSFLETNQSPIATVFRQQQEKVTQLLERMVTVLEKDKNQEGVVQIIPADFNG